MMIPKGKKPGRIKPKPPRSKAHRDYVRAQPCCVCRRIGVSAHHLIAYYGEDGPISGKGMKAGDQWAVPLCYGCHQGQDSLHHQGDEQVFLAQHNVDGLTVARTLALASPSAKIRNAAKATTEKMEHES